MRVFKVSRQTLVLQMREIANEVMRDQRSIYNDKRTKNITKLVS